jgi:hypothetical protein
MLQKFLPRPSARRSEFGRCSPCQKDEPFSKYSSAARRLKFGGDGPGAEPRRDYAVANRMATGAAVERERSRRRGGSARRATCFARILASVTKKL